MKNQLAKSLSRLDDVLKKPVCNAFKPKEKYVPSQNTIQALEIAYKKRVNEKKQKILSM